MSRSSINPLRHNFGQLSQLAISFALGSFRAEIIGWGFIEPRWWRNYQHSHSYFEVCCAFAGEGVFRINGIEHRVKRGDLFVARPGEDHEIISSRTRPMGIYFWGYSLARGASQGTEAVDELIDAFAASRKSVSAGAAEVERTCELLAMEAAGRKAGYSIAVEGLTRKLLLDTARGVTGEILEEPAENLGRSVSQRVVKTAIRYLRDNYTRPIGVRDVAAQVHLSERQLSRLFVQAEGKSITQYLTGLRMDAAKRMLLQDRPIKEIAAEVGYPDVHYFTTLFGKQAGMTPAAYRAGGGTIHLTKKRHVQP